MFVPLLELSSGAIDKKLLSSWWRDGPSKLSTLLIEVAMRIRALGGGPDGPEICRVVVCEFGSPEEADDPIPSVKLDFNTPSPSNTVTTVIIASQHCKHLLNQTLNSSRLFALFDAPNDNAFLSFLIPNTSYCCRPWSKHADSSLSLLSTTNNAMPRAL